MQMCEGIFVDSPLYCKILIISMGIDVILLFYKKKKKINDICGFVSDNSCMFQ